jgi:hypothetical protein
VIDLDKLEQLARAAPPGPWEYHEDSGFLESRAVSSPGVHASRGIGMMEIYGGDHDTGRFLAAANPDAVLELLARLRAAEAALEVIRSWSNSDGGHAVEMQMLAAEALFPGKFPTPDHLRAALRRAVEAVKP